MKIVHVINSLATGGAERLVVNFAKTGIDKGHEISIITLSDQKGVPSALAKDYNIPVHSIRLPVKDPRNIFKLRRLTSQADIVHVHIFPSFYWGSFLKKPKVYTEHNAHNRRRGRKIFSLLERWAYQSYDRVIVISAGVDETLRTHLQTVGAQPKISFAANGVGDEFFSVDRTYSKRPNRLTMIGSLKPAKRPDLAIRALAYLDGVNLAIAGNGPMRSELEILVSNLGLEDRVQFLGNVSNVPELLKNSDLFLTTSQYEGMSTVVVEAQATGIPVVGAAVRGVSEIVADGKSGLLFQGDTPETVAATIAKALSSEVYPSLCQNARENVKEFSLENSFNAQMRIYREVLSDKTPGKSN